MRVHTKAAWFRPHFDDEDDDDLLLEMAEDLPGFWNAEADGDDKQPLEESP